MAGKEGRGGYKGIEVVDVDYVGTVLEEYAFHGAYSRNTIYAAEESMDFTSQCIAASTGTPTKYLHHIAVFAIVGNELVHYGFLAAVLTIVIVDNQYFHLGSRV
jgi:hypothetical protein